MKKHPIAYGLLAVIILISNPTLASSTPELLWQKTVASPLHWNCLKNPNIGDINNDNASDVICQRLIVQSTVSDLIAVSGRDGSTLWEKAIYHVRSLDTIDDVNGDRIKDIAVLFYYTQAGGDINPRVVIYSGMNGAEISHFDVFPTDPVYFGPGGNFVIEEELLITNNLFANGRSEIIINLVFQRPPLIPYHEIKAYRTSGELLWSSATDLPVGIIPGIIHRAGFRNVTTMPYNPMLREGRKRIIFSAQPSISGNPVYVLSQNSNGAFWAAPLVDYAIYMGFGVNFYQHPNLEVRGDGLFYLPLNSNGQSTNLLRKISIENGNQIVRYKERTNFWLSLPVSYCSNQTLPCQTQSIVLPIENTTTGRAIAKNLIIHPNGSSTSLWTKELGGRVDHPLPITSVVPVDSMIGSDTDRDIVLVTNHPQYPQEGKIYVIDGKNASTLLEVNLLGANGAFGIKDVNGDGRNDLLVGGRYTIQVYGTN